MILSSPHTERRRKSRARDASTIFAWQSERTLKCSALDCSNHIDPDGVCGAYIKRAVKRLWASLHTTHHRSNGCVTSSRHTSWSKSKRFQQSNNRDDTSCITLKSSALDFSIHIDPHGVCGAYIKRAIKLQWASLHTTSTTPPIMVYTETLQGIATCRTVDTKLNCVYSRCAITITNL